MSAELRSIGFHNSYENGTAFLEWSHDNLEELLRDHINNNDSTIAPPDLEEQIENDPAVKAAKQKLCHTFFALKPRSRQIFT